MTLDRKDDSTLKMEAIKELIFGDAIQVYDSEFEVLKQDIATKKEVLENIMEEARKELQSAIDNVTTDLNTRIDEVGQHLETKIERLKSTKVDKNILDKVLFELGENIRHTRQNKVRV